MSPDLSLLAPKCESDYFQFANWSALNTRRDSVRHNVILGAVTGADNSWRGNKTERARRLVGL